MFKINKISPAHMAAAKISLIVALAFLSVGCGATNNKPLSDLNESDTDSKKADHVVVQKISKNEVEVDNSEINARDTQKGPPTSEDQKENADDLLLTQKIRQAVVSDDSLSLNAKNIKIISQNGRVTLRGPVKTALEKEKIGANAREIAGETNVDNQLEVKSL